VSSRVGLPKPPPSLAPLAAPPGLASSSSILSRSPLAPGCVALSPGGLPEPDGSSSPPQPAVENAAANTTIAIAASGRGRRRSLIGCNCRGTRWWAAMVVGLRFQTTGRVNGDRRSDVRRQRST